MGGPRPVMGQPQQQPPLNAKFNQGVTNAPPQQRPGAQPQPGPRPQVPNYAQRAAPRPPQPEPGVSVPGQPDLTASALAQASPAEQKQMLGERLYPLIQQVHPDDAGKITGMLLEIDNSELLHMLEHGDSLKAKVEEAVAVLQAHHAKSQAIKKE